MCHLDLAISMGHENMRAHEDKGVLVVLSCIIPVKHLGFSAVHGKEVGPGIAGPERLKELLEGGMEAGGLECQHFSNYMAATVKWVWRTTSDRFERLPAPAAGFSSPRARASPSVVIVAR